MSYSTYNKHKRDKTGLRFILTIIFGLMVSATSVWAIVEFALYLVKDDPFNWTSIWLFIAAVVLEIYFFSKLALSD